MSSAFFYCASIPTVGGTVALAAPESRHVIGPRRLVQGDAVELFDGAGTVARAVIRALESRPPAVVVEILSVEQWPSPRPRVHIAAALPKGDRQRVLFDMSTQLGMASFTPLSCRRSIAKPGRGALQRWRRICVEACKQSRRAHLPQLCNVESPRDFALRMCDLGAVVLLAHHTGRPLTSLNCSSVELGLVVGPEGGLTDEELAETDRAGAVAVTLGPGVLRVETAVVAGLSVIVASAQ